MGRLSVGGAETRASRIIRAPRRTIYEAFLDADTLASWLPPDGMRGEVHAFEPREGGRFRLSLTYRDPRRASDGKTDGATDTVRGRFAALVPGEKVVWAVAFEAGNPAFGGEMTVTWALRDAEGGTEVTVLTEGLPPGVRPEDNEVGSRSSLRNLAALLERADPTPPPKPDERTQRPAGRRR